MVKERAPPKQLRTGDGDGDGNKREKSPESDTDISALISGWTSLKGNVRADSSDVFASATAHPAAFGHPTKMMSSRKQKADIFIRQKTRPEHHIDNKVAGPRAPTYEARKAPPPPMFSSTSTSMPQPPRHEDEVFYTDPAKASEDLKALLEGGIEGDDDEGVESEGKQETAGGGKEPKEGSAAKGAVRDPKTISKDGSVDGLKVQLLPHQVEGVNWMRGRELGPVKKGTVPKGGLLADDMGLGKTLQSISIVLINQKPQKGEEGWKKHFQSIDKTTLVVAPLALIRQWEAEIKEKVAETHGLKVLVHHGPQRTKRFEDLKAYDVVITTYQILVSEHGKSGGDIKTGCFGLHWWRIILDEAHTIKNRNAKSTKACCALRSEYRWCLSGTPMQNNLEELQSLVKFLRIRPYDDIKAWKDQIELPLKGGKGHIALRRLHSFLRCFMKRRTKEILKKDGALTPGGVPSAGGAASINGFRHTSRKVVTIAAELSPAERKFYQKLEARADQSMTRMMREKISYANAFTLLLRLRQACNHPKLLEGKLGEDKDALSTGYANPKQQDADVDSMADLFSGMGISTKQCSICGRPVEKKERDSGNDNCAECASDLAFFYGEEKNKKKKNKKRAETKKATKAKSPRSSKKNQVHKGKDNDHGEEDVETRRRARRPRNRNTVVDSDDEDGEGARQQDDSKQEETDEEPKQRARRHRNRNAVIDSEDEEEDDDEEEEEDDDDDGDGDDDDDDDDEKDEEDDEDDEEEEEEGEGEEGSWLVSENERGALRLGKAGGEEDENAEGGGDSIGSEDSEDEDSEEEDDDQDKSNLSSFVVDDSVARKEKGYKSVDEASDDDSLLSISEITQSMAAQTLEDKKSKAKKSKAPRKATASVSDDDSEAGSGSEGDLESESDSEEGESDGSSERDRSPDGKGIFSSAKIRELTKLLRAEAHEHKFIVFSQFTSMLDLVEPFLRKEGFRFTRYDGSMKNDEREESLRSLREDEKTRVLLCSLKCGSLGLNLTAATRVIIIEPFWNPFVEEQAIDRVHRLTQTVDVVVYKLTVTHTVEEGILELQEKKRLLAEQTIEGSSKKGALKLGINEIIDLFKPISTSRGRDDPYLDYDDEADAERRRARDAMSL
ncbi:snf2 family helicase atpase [Trichoderma cornu-damae]|uniref:Snf2 family helicase atpase n=1 Tax=Trichoderma cornu-damae TaxID=654480 RepID=A0A9P8QNZ3_9HYPO|nr:snf2 family helicase atpase [Trichoderma cornu-damae]